MGQARFLRHSVIFYNPFWSITEYKTPVHMFMFIQTDAPEHLRPGRQLSAFFHLFILDVLPFPLRMLFNKLCVRPYGSLRSYA